MNALGGAVDGNGGALVARMVDVFAAADAARMAELDRLIRAGHGNEEPKHEEQCTGGHRHAAVGGKAAPTPSAAPARDEPLPARPRPGRKDGRCDECGAKTCHKAWCSRSSRPRRPKPEPRPPQKPGPKPGRAVAALAMVGLRYGHLAVLEMAGLYRAPGGQTQRLVTVQCDCGSTFDVVASRLRRKGGQRRCLACARRHVAAVQRGRSTRTDNGATLVELSARTGISVNTLQQRWGRGLRGAELVQPLQVHRRPEGKG